MAHVLEEYSLEPKIESFIFASEFGLEHIPNGFRSPTILQYIKNVSARTVKVVRDSCFNSGRPELSTCGGQEGDKQYGSGLVVKVEYLNWTCECLECQDSSEPRTHCWAVIVHTALQLVADAEEAKSTQVELFYDDQFSRDEGRVITLQGADIEMANSFSYASMLVCFTHDADLAKQLDDYRKESMDLKSAILKEKRDQVDLTQYAVVCHPMGQQKCIWVGSKLGRVRSSGMFQSTPIIYRARMCPGVQGGPVIVLHGQQSEDLVWEPVVDGSFSLSENPLPPFNFASSGNFSGYC